MLVVCTSTLRGDDLNYSQKPPGDWLFGFSFSNLLIMIFGLTASSGCCQNQPSNVCENIWKIKSSEKSDQTRKEYHFVLQLYFPTRHNNPVK